MLIFITWLHVIPCISFSTKVLILPTHKYAYVATRAGCVTTRHNPLGYSKLIFNQTKYIKHKRQISIWKWEQRWKGQCTHLPVCLYVLHTCGCTHVCVCHKCLTKNYKRLPKTQSEARKLHTNRKHFFIFTMLLVWYILAYSRRVSQQTRQPTI